MAKARVAMQEEFDLPMRGLTQTPDGFVQYPKVTLRAMTTLEEKARLSGNGYKSIVNLVRSCIVDGPKDIENMNTIDVQYMIYMLRALTYGSDYSVSVQCPRCGKINKISVNLRDLPVDEIDDNFSGEFELEQLPISKDVITCKIETSKDIESVDRECSRILRKFPEYVGDPELIIKWCYRITAVNGNKVNTNDVQRYVESMHAMDYRFMDSKYNKAIGKYGVDTSLFVTCDCGEEFDTSMPVNSEFFRPEY